MLKYMSRFYHCDTRRDILSETTSRNHSLKVLVRTYKILMIILSLLIMSLSIWDLAFKFSEKTIRFINKFDLFVMSVFIIDLFVNLKLAKDKKHFIKVSIIEIIIITPFMVLLKIPGLLKKSTGINIATGVRPSYIERFPRLKGFISILLSQKFILRSSSFIMKPSVIRVAKFFNLSRNYFNKTKSKKD